ncbi:MAG TPA: hypothetical protein VMZ03_02700 [Chitinophagaceae bacterium]|nr:hypothetical protein [Chitinophagaceae bacterium]
MLRYLFLISLFLPLTMTAQEYLGKTRAELRTELHKYTTTSGKAQILTETDSTLVISPKDDAIRPVTYIYSLDKKGKCIYEKIITTCKECFEESLQLVLSKNQYEWKKINENQYVSKYDAHVLLELPPDDNLYYLTIFPMNWTRELYELMLKN